MRCQICKTTMKTVGSVGRGRDRRVFAEGFVCPKIGCSGYGAVRHLPGGVKSAVQYPAMTLMTSDPLHARIAGAIAFKGTW